MITTININDIPQFDRGHDNRNKKDILAFLESGALAAEISIPAESTAGKVAASYAVTAKRIRGARVIRRGSRVFLIKEATDGLDTP